jgi:hypothetical protein
MQIPCSSPPRLAGGEKKQNAKPMDFLAPALLWDPASLG